eukprot:CAMPEP_0173259436 /NCGR_PEP_ID=MMETSP1142-20121109/24987_1 /TAXON_ID=483371 /ORGANISM="non described non described, Strain CCMP2298" /LENGTH=41 /DNA_ID= /DNA_START= /DNA_END= /DNA_ORIENTATION=
MTTLMGAVTPSLGSCSIKAAPTKPSASGIAPARTRTSVRRP